MLVLPRQRLSAFAACGLPPLRWHSLCILSRSLFLAWQVTSSPLRVVEMREEAIGCQISWKCLRGALNWKPVRNRCTAPAEDASMSRWSCREPNFQQLPRHCMHWLSATHRQASHPWWRRTEVRPLSRLFHSSFTGADSTSTLPMQGGKEGVLCQGCSSNAGNLGAGRLCYVLHARKQKQLGR